MRNPRAHTAAIVACVLILAGCTSDDEWPEGLTDIRDTDPPEQGDPDDADESDKAAADDGSDDSTETHPSASTDAPADSSQVSDAQHDPEDETHGFEINEELELEPNEQRRLLEFYREGHEVFLAALAGSGFSEAELRGYYDGAELDGVLDELAAFERDGLVQRSDGIATEFLRLEEAGGGTAVIHHCTSASSEDGIVDAETGEFVFQREGTYRVTGNQLALTQLEDDSVDWRIVGSFVDPEVPCP